MGYVTAQYVCELISLPMWSYTVTPFEIHVYDNMKINQPAIVLLRILISIIFNVII